MFFVYLLANRKQGALYIGQTNDLVRRVSEHKSGEQSGFTRQYGCTRLVWFESHNSRESAFARERQMKAWKRAWKVRRIEASNPDWDDLSLNITEANIYAPEHMHRPYALEDVC